MTTKSQYILYHKRKKFFIVKYIAFFFSFLLLLVQLFFYCNISLINETNAACISASSAVILILMAGSFGYILKNWMLWFAVFYFMLYQLGPIVGIIFIDPEISYIDYATTFSNTTNADSRSISYLLSGFVANLLSIYVFILKPKLARLPPNDFILERVSFFIWALSSPFVFVHYIWHFLTFSTNYVLSYSSEAKEILSIVPYAWVFTNLFWIGFYLWFASVPQERSFNKCVLVYILISFISSLYGGRIIFIIPLCFVFWYRSLAYGREISKASMYLVVVLAFLFIFLMEVIRADQVLSYDYLIDFFIRSISKAQYSLSLYVNYIDVVNQNGGNFWVAPLLFPLSYLIHGGSIVGQAPSSALLRGDLNHVMSSTLNYEAYISGAGLGSTLVSESFEYGIYGIPVIILSSYLFYRYLFNGISNRLCLMIIPNIFMHFVFSGRDSLFPNLWGSLKFVFAYIIVSFLISLFRSRFSRIGI